MPKPAPSPIPVSDEALTDMTLNDVVEEIQNLRGEVTRLRNERIGGIGDTFWGVAFGVAIGVPLVLFVIFVVLAVAGVALSDL